MFVIRRDTNTRNSLMRPFPLQPQLTKVQVLRSIDRLLLPHWRGVGVGGRVRVWWGCRVKVRQESGCRLSNAIALPNKLGWASDVLCACFRTYDTLHVTSASHRKCNTKTRNTNKHPILRQYCLSHIGLILSLNSVCIYSR